MLLCRAPPYAGIDMLFQGGVTRPVPHAERLLHCLVCRTAGRDSLRAFGAAPSFAGGSASRITRKERGFRGYYKPKGKSGGRFFPKKFVKYPRDPHDLRDPRGAEAGEARPGAKRS
jgi:hypothetical protein